MIEKQKMTVYNSSAGTDERQPQQKLVNGIIAKGNTKINPDNKLETISMTELYDTAYFPKKPLIEGLLYNGIYIFVGAPKTGKSFAMEQIGYHISKGINIWDRKVSQGTVLYLALEDDYSRLQSRLYKMFGVDDTPNYYFSVKSKMVANGLENQLKEFIDEHKDTSLIIIDTLQKVRELSGDSFSYAKDYDVITSLKNFADENNICIVLVHHTRKQEATDAFDAISGTNGLFGAADGAFVLHKDKRTNSDAILDISGRDIQEQRLHLHRSENCIWELLKSEIDTFEEPKDEIVEEISLLINKQNPIWQGTAKQLAEHISINIRANQLTRKLNCNLSVLCNDYHIEYKNVRKKDGVYISLKLID